jgi:hypothetical protein
MKMWALSSTKQFLVLSCLIFFSYFSFIQGVPDVLEHVKCLIKNKP